MSSQLSTKSAAAIENRQNEIHRAQLTPKGVTTAGHRNISMGQDNTMNMGTLYIHMRVIRNQNLKLKDLTKSIFGNSSNLSSGHFLKSRLIGYTAI